MKKYLSLAAASLLFFIVSQAHAAIVLDATSSASSATTTTSLAWQHTIGAGLSGSALIVECAAGSITNNVCSSVKWGSTTMTKAVTGRETGAGNGAAIFYLLNPTPGTATVTVTFAGSGPPNSAAAAVSLSGVNQTTPVDATTTSPASAGTLTSTIRTTVSNDWIFSAISVGTSNSGRINGVVSPFVKAYPVSGTATQGLEYGGPFVSVGSTTFGFTASGFTQQDIVSAAIEPSSAPHVTSASTTVGGDGGRSGDTITLTGTNFGVVSATNTATCNGGGGTGCIDFIAGGNDTVATSSISSWTNTSITFTISPALGSNGGVGAIQVWAADASDTSPYTFYIYPNITSMASVGTNVARTYNASDTDGLIMLVGDHFGASGTSSILGVAATQYNSTAGSCSVSGYTTTSACFEVPPTINSSTYSGTITLTRGSDSKQATTSLSILPRITGVSPGSAYQGQMVQILGDHLCGPSGTCPVSPNRGSITNNVAFGNTTTSDALFVNQTGGAGTCNGSGAAWAQGEICLDLPALSAGSASSTVVSNGNISNAFSFTATNPPAPGTPGTPTFASINSSTLTVNWTAASGVVNYYTVERATSSALTSPTTLATTTATSTGDSGLLANTTYYYAVEATNGGGSGSWSASSSILTLPGAPGTPTYNNLSTSSLTVNWTAPAGGASWYIIERATSSQVYAQLSTTSALTYNDSGLTKGGTYYYEIIGANATGNGAASATSSITTLFNAPPNAPTENSPANGVQDLTTTPTFTMTATDPDGNSIQYEVTIYSGTGCSGSAVQTDDESASQTGWSGQNASSGAEYSSGSQGTYAVQSALLQNTAYSWIANAKDPEGSDIWGASSTCGSFSTTAGKWTTDAGSWAINSSQLVATPGAGVTAQLHATGVSQTAYIVEFKAKSSAGGGFSEYRDSVSGGTLTPLLSGALSVSGSSILSGGPVGLTASSSGGTTFTFDNFAAYTGTTITMNGLSGADSWSVRDHASTTIACQTGSTWDLSAYSGQVPIDYDNGGGTLAVWTNGTCSGAPDEVYPASGLSTDIFGGDSYTYTEGVSSTPATGGGSVVATTTITISAAGAVGD